MRLAASRTFWTAGNSRPIRMAMIAMTTSSSISVKPRRKRERNTARTSRKRNDEQDRLSAATGSLGPRFWIEERFDNRLDEAGQVVCYPEGCGVQGNNASSTGCRQGVEPLRGRHT